jgi:hypothetical protein
MAAPNIVNVGSIYGKTALLQLTTSASSIITNVPNSGQLYKVNSLYVANVDGTAAFSVTIDILRINIAYRIGYLIAVPALATLDVISKPIYLEEGDSLRLTSSGALKLDAVASYEVITL